VLNRGRSLTLQPSVQLQVLKLDDSCRGQLKSKLKKEAHLMKVSRGIVVALALGALFTGLVGCRKEGPAERAGKDIDRSAEKAGQQMEKAGDKIKDTINDMKR
jgi:hypothetical protein